jgi:hypothetical protein
VRRQRRATHARGVVAVLAVSLLVVAARSSATTTTAPTTTTSAAASTTSPGVPSAPCTGAPAPARYTHVVVVVMENKRLDQVLGTPDAPWFDERARECGVVTRYAQVASPSRPNYIAMTSGTVAGCAGSNADPGASCRPPSPSLFRQVLDRGGTVVSYAESAPTNCALVSSGRYAAKHNPWAYFADERAACREHDVAVPPGFTLGDPDALPTLAFVAPDTCDDTHDCGVAHGDAFLRRLLDPVLASSTYRRGETAVIVTYDEYTPLPNLIMARAVGPGSRYGGRFDHYGLLRTVEDALGLPPLGRAAGATSLRASPLHL